jgi:hypothetical protein
MKNKIVLLAFLPLLAFLLCAAFWNVPNESIVNLRAYETTLTNELISPFTAEAMTTPTLTIDATNKYFVTLTTDINMTGVTLTNGTVGQQITFVSGAGSNTIRFDDDGINMALGANITLTEGQSDCLTLVNTATGDWAAVNAHDN